MLQRLAVALLVLCALGAAAAVFAPASSGGTDCGTVVSPEYDSAEVERFLEQGTATREDAQGLGIDTSDLDASLVGVAAAARRCDDALGGRQTIAWVLLGLAVLVPLGILFVAGRRPSTGTDA